MKVVLTRKHADRIDGIDLSEYRVGDVLELTLPDAKAIVAEGWALPDRRTATLSSSPRRRASD
jgi:hypothetical protein